jgi:2-methylcitrate dehydratase PrpD
MDRVTCFEDTEIEAAYPESWGAVVRVRYRDGSVEERRSSDPLGSPSRPLDRDGILAKAAGLLGDDWASEARRAVAGVADAGELSAALEPLRTRPS